MLCYQSTGERDYARKPVAVYRRPYWEFQAVVGGRIAMVDAEGAGRMRSRHLWLSAPGYAHGWTGESDATAEVVVFQFLSVPEPVVRQVPKGGLLEIELKKGQGRQLKDLAQRADQFWRRPRPEILLRHEHLLMELSLLVCEAVSEQGVFSQGGGHLRVREALEFFAENMARNPGMEEVAQAAGSSVSHLRRQFQEVMRDPPKKIFDQLRFQRAMQMMADPDTKLEWVSEACGFESPATFSRAFKAKFGCGPAAWRGRGGGIPELVPAQKH